MAEEISSELGQGVTAMDGGLGSEISYFGDKEAVLKAIAIICADEKEFETQFTWLNPVLSKYQEQPVLLQAALPEMIDPLTEKMLEIIEKDRSL